MRRIRDFFDNIRHIDAILTKQAETQDYICSHLQTIADLLYIPMLEKIDYEVGARLDNLMELMKQGKSANVAEWVATLKRIQDEVRRTKRIIKLP